VQKEKKRKIEKCLAIRGSREEGKIYLEEGGISLRGTLGGEKGKKPDKKERMS